VIEEIHSANPTIPTALLELIWDSVKKLDDRKLKQLRKGTYKFKPGQRIVRKQYEDGQVITGACEIVENATPPIKTILEENKDEPLSIEDADEEERDGTEEGRNGEGDA